jgi:hypothetical protein
MKNGQPKRLPVFYGNTIAANSIVIHHGCNRPEAAGQNRYSILMVARCQYEEIL